MNTTRPSGPVRRSGTTVRPPAAPGAALRAQAARALAQVALDGVSLRHALAQANPRIADARDRALLAALLYAASRWWLRLDAAFAALLDKPLPPKAREVRALLVLGFAELDVLGHADYAVVASCVEAARTLGQPHYAGLVNAVLRRFLRERAALDATPRRRSRHAPRASALADRCARRGLARARRRDPRRQQSRSAADAARQSSPRHARRNCSNACTRPPSTPARPTTSPMRSCSPPAPTSLACPVTPRAPSRCRTAPRSAWSNCSICADGQRVLDACAAPGGKAAHLLERADVRSARARSRRRSACRACTTTSPASASPRGSSPATRPNRRRGGTGGRSIASCSMRRVRPPASSAASRTSSCIGAARTSRCWRRRSGCCCTRCGRCSRRAGAWSTPPARCCARRTRR